MASTYTVKRGDTLWGIAQTYLGDPYKYTYLAQINNIPNPSLIYVGQVIKLSAGGSSSSGSSSKPSSSAPTKATINQFGLQSDTDRTVFATWNWSRSNTKEYKIRWWYATADGVALLGTETTTNFTHSTYTAPTNAEKTWFHVMPVSNTYTSNGTSYSYWTAQWSNQVTYYFKDNPPTTPTVPTVTIEDYKLTAELDNLDVNGTEIQFQIVKDDITLFNSGTATIILNHASYSCTVDAGSEYKVRCRAVRDDKYSDWSEYSSNVGTPPSAPTSVTVCRAASKTSVYLEWTAVQNADTYDLEYTTNRNYFDNSDGTTVQTGIEFNHFEKTGLETGQEYFFRVRAVNDDGESGWSEIKSCNIGSDPAAPTTWSSTTTAIVGEPLNLYWVHNSADGSSQTYAELEIYINGLKETYTIKNTDDEDEKDKTSVYPIDTSTYVEGTKIQWRVRTAGVTLAYGEWSVQRTIDVYAPPTLQLNMTDANSSGIQTLSSFPFYVSALAGPKTQAPIGYQLTVTSNQYYETVDDIGNRKIVNEGDEVFSRYFDITEALLVEFSASNIDLENNMEYTVSCRVTMNSGLTADASLEFNVAWEETIYTPNAAISVDPETIVAYIRPYCEIYPVQYYKVDNSTGSYIATDEVIDSDIEGISIDDLTDTGEIVYEADGPDGTKIYFRIAISETPVLVENVSLSVYRREFDGSFTEIATGLLNSENTYVTDPHPALDYARYRIVATEISTGAVSYYDVPGVPTGETAVIIQWDEEWSEFNTSSEEPLAEPPWSGSMLRLPYNIDVSDTNDTDVALVNYAGRKYPVSYYGTQIGATSTWNVDIEKSDKDTLYALRRLMVWMGDVYVREPSGSGYWANISVSFSQTHRKLVIPVTLTLTRVEGGV